MEQFDGVLSFNMVYKVTNMLAQKPERVLTLSTLLNFTKTWSFQTRLFGYQMVRDWFQFGMFMAKSITNIEKGHHIMSDGVIS